MWGSEALACGWLERSMEERNIPPVWWHVAIMKNVYVDLSQGMRCTQTCATTQFEQTIMVPIEAPPFSGLRANYNIFLSFSLSIYVIQHPILDACGDHHQAGVLTGGS